MVFIVAVVALAATCTLLGAGNWVLSYVDPFEPPLGVIRPQEDPTAIVVLIIVIALAAAATAGLRRVRRARRTGQAVGGVIVLAGTWLGLRIYGALLFSYAPPCRYDGCWPHTAQSLAAATPAVLLGVTMLVAALVPRGPEAVRTWAPTAAWLVLVAVQHAMWDAVVIPLFTGPPP